MSPAGRRAAPAGWLALASRPLDLREFLMLALAVVAFNYAAATAGPGGMAASIPSGAVVLVLGVLVRDLWRMRPRRIDGADWIAFGVLLILGALPHRAGSVVALGLLGALCLRSPGPAARGAGILQIGLSAWDMHSMLWAGFVSPLVLAAEAEMIALLISIPGFNARVTGNVVWIDREPMLVVMRGCSILSLAYPVALASYALSRLARPAEYPGPWPICRAMALLFPVNLMRLAMMATSDEMVRTLHGGVPLGIF